MNPKDSDQIFDSVPFAQINPSHNFDEKVFNYFNPRIFTNKNNEVKYTQEEIDFMKQSIIKHGLLSPLILNKSEDDYYILDGHRRHEAIRQLIAENADCFKQTTKTWVKAQEYFSTIKAQIFKNLTTSDAFTKAFHIDSNKIAFSENVVIKFIDYCCQYNQKKEFIANMCNKTVAYVKNVIQVIKTLENDEILKQHLFDGKIALNVVEKLVNDYKNIEERHEIIDSALAFAEERSKQKIEKIDDLILTAVTKINRTKQNKADAVSRGDFSEVEKLDDDLMSHMNNLNERKEQRNRIMPTINSTDISKVTENKSEKNNKNINLTNQDMQTSSKETNDASLTAGKLKTFAKYFSDWHEQVETMISNHNLTKDGDFVPPLINNFVNDLLKILRDRCDDMTYEQFIYNWVPKFVSNGLASEANDQPINENQIQTSDDDNDELTGIDPIDELD